MQILPITTMRLWQMQPLTETEFLAFLDRHTVYCLTKKPPQNVKNFSGATQCDTDLFFALLLTYNRAASHGSG